jgi:hypothetical protein
MVFFGEDPLRRAIDEFLVYDHYERIHQDLGNRLICPQEKVGTVDGSVECRESLGGVLRYYHRDVA